ncbi:hypothetical protein HK097_007661 [Rhizophlyctis rosea]|uniref:Uncharacterized protein n=1 Tax=Rhizophlyctis rosea TaxID=64517 RepID=A0AAD5SDI6_9FUNG|nr:hypothetical protein HK097_007661 [Rhizophlyctis rosea]
MSIKTVEDLNKVLEKLSLDPQWASVNSEVKQTLINDYHKTFAENLFDEAAKDVLPKKAPPKRGRRKKTDTASQTEVSHSDGELNHQ